MSKITKETIQKGIQTGTVKFIERDGITVCQIGALWFRFMPEKCSLDQFEETFSTSQAAHLVFDAIQRPSDEQQNMVGYCLACLHNI